MNVYEIRDPDLARRHLATSLWLARNDPTNPQTVGPALDWAMEIASEGGPLPLAGFVSDVGHVALGSLHEPHAKPGEPPHVDRALVRKYEDYVLGKLYADMAFQRGADALLRYQGRDRARGAAFLINRIRERAGLGGVILSPAVVKSIQESVIDQVLADAWQAIEQDGFSPQILNDLAELVDGVRNTGDLLGSEDIFELEHGTALAQFAQRVALRQVLQAAERLEQTLPREKIRPQVRHHQVATQIVDEDFYPIGGYASISNRGSVESLLHSQLSYMEPDDRPDLFDIKFLRDELLYYSRDENRFLRRRRTFIFALYPALTQARFKDAGLPWQRIVLLMALLLAAVGKLIDWLAGDALTVELVFLDSDGAALDQERNLLETLLARQIENSTVVIEQLPAAELSAHCDQRAQRSACHCLTIDVRDEPLECNTAHVSRLTLDRAEPRLSIDGPPQDAADHSGFDHWAETLRTLLESWV